MILACLECPNFLLSQIHSRSKGTLILEENIRTYDVNLSTYPEIESSLDFYLACQKQIFLSFLDDYLSNLIILILNQGLYALSFVP